eukprot:m.143304 g.143304  ORF g.143304 m.143304 type:complete len:60 (-) comp14088_c0_seq4:399-578(-)
MFPKSQAGNDGSVCRALVCESGDSAGDSAGEAFPEEDRADADRILPNAEVDVEEVGFLS